MGELVLKIYSSYKESKPNGLLFLFSLKMGWLMLNSLLNQHF